MLIVLLVWHGLSLLFLRAFDEGSWRCHDGTTIKSSTLMNTDAYFTTDLNDRIRRPLLPRLKVGDHALLGLLETETDNFNFRTGHWEERSSAGLYGCVTGCEQIFSFALSLWSLGILCLRAEEQCKLRSRVGDAGPHTALSLSECAVVRMRKCWERGRERNGSFIVGVSHASRGRALALINR